MVGMVSTLAFLLRVVDQGDLFGFRRDLSREMASSRQTGVAVGMEVHTVMGAGVQAGE